MKQKSDSIREETERVQCQARISKICKIVESFRKSHPRDFHPSEADICWLQEVRMTISNGTDEEFEACEADIRSRIPELSATWLKERRQFFLTLLPQDSPAVEHLSLATTMFDCLRCGTSGMHVETALSHGCVGHLGGICDYGCECGEECESRNLSATCVSLYKQCFHQRQWRADYEYSTELSALFREIALECGEDPDSITTKEMNRKYHRFACFHAAGTVTVLNWSETVSSRACRSEGTVPDLLCVIS